MLFCYFLVLFLKLHPLLLSALLSLLLPPSLWHACFHSHQFQMDTSHYVQCTDRNWAPHHVRWKEMQVLQPSVSQRACKSWACSCWSCCSPVRSGDLQLVIYTCLSLWSAMQMSASIPAVPVQEGPDAHVGSPGVTACTQLGMHPAPSPGHNPKGRNVFRVELSSWESAGSRLPREARCSRHYSFSQPGRAARMILPHPWGISQERCTSVVSPWAERQTSMCMATINTCVLFARQWKNTTKARRWKDVKAGSEWGKCTFAANGSAGDLQWGVFTSALPLMKSQLGKQCSHWFISCRYCGNTDLLPSLHWSIY